MGVTNWAKLVAHFQSDAIVPTKKSERKATNNAFYRAGVAQQVAELDQTHLYTLLASVGWMNAIDGKDLFMAFFRGPLNYFETYAKHATDSTLPPILVLLWDKSHYVNPGKRACQEAREKSQSKKTPYGPLVSYARTGVRPDDTAIEQPIDIDRAVFARGPARTALRRFLLSELTAQPALLKWPVNTQLYVDSAEGVSVFMATEAGELYEYDPASATATGAMGEDEIEGSDSCPPKPALDPLKMRNTLGEADIASVRWTAALKRPTRLITTDSDWAMLHVYHLWPRVDITPEVIWDNGKDISQFHVHRMIKSLRDTHQFTREALLVLGILSGCDYFKKNHATDKIGHDDLYEGMKMFMLASSPRTGKPRPNLRTLDGMRDALWHIYAYHYNVEPTEEALSKVKKSPKKAGLLFGADQLAEVFVQYRLALDYFSLFICWNPAKDPALLSLQTDNVVHIDATRRIEAMQLK